MNDGFMFVGVFFFLLKMIFLPSFLGWAERFPANAHVAAARPDTSVWRRENKGSDAAPSPPANCRWVLHGPLGMWDIPHKSRSNWRIYNNNTKTKPKP